MATIASLFRSLTVCLFLITSVSFSNSFALPLNFHKVDDQLFRGARPESVRDFDDLKRLGIKIVINLQGGDIRDDDLGWLIPHVEAGETVKERQREKYLAESQGLQYYNFPLNSLGEVTSSQEKQILNALRVILSGDSDSKVFIHCAHGADRTGLVVALYRVIINQWSKEKAYQEMIDLGHDLLHQVFTSHLDRYFWNDQKTNQLKAKLQKMIYYGHEEDERTISCKTLDGSLIAVFKGSSDALTLEQDSKVIRSEDNIHIELFAANPENADERVVLGQQSEANLRLISLIDKTTAEVIVNMKWPELSNSVRRMICQL